MLKQSQVENSVVEHQGTTYALVMTEQGEKRLLINGDTQGFSGESADSGLICPLNAENAAALRQRLAWLNPVPLGLRTSAGFGDRLGIATPGHILATRGTGVAPIFAQQSVRENSRIGRTPQQVVDAAVWGVFEAGWRSDWGADADHMKTPDDIPAFVAAGYTFYTIDPSEHVDNHAETDDLATLEAKAAALDWQTLQTSFADSKERFLRTIELDGISLSFDDHALLKALTKYGAAVAHTARMAQALQSALGGKPFEMEMSVDETETTTSLQEHFYIASELKRLNIPFVSLAPRFVGRFEKGVDYIGDLGELEENMIGHAAIMRHFGNSYKLSLHTGSDKFGVYPIAMKHTGGRVHLKTAGTSYLEALRLIANVDVPLFREILEFARGRYEIDRKSYHVSAVLDKVPVGADLSDAQLPDLLNQFDARQVLHVTFGSTLDHFGVVIHALLRANQQAYWEYLRVHFDKHLQPLRTAE